LSPPIWQEKSPQCIHLYCLAAQLLCWRTTSLTAGGVGVSTPTYALSLIFAADGGDKRSAA